MINLLSLACVTGCPIKLCIANLIVSSRHKLVPVSFLWDGDCFVEMDLHTLEFSIQVPEPLPLRRAAFRLRQEVVLNPVPDLFFGHLSVG